MGENYNLPKSEDSRQPQCPVEMEKAIRDSNIASVDKKGKIKGKNKGSCYVYAYAQNGVFSKIKVTVK